MCSIQNRQTKKNNDSNNDDCKCIPFIATSQGLPHSGHPPVVATQEHYLIV